MESLFARERETILNAISLDIWTAAGLMKGFQPLLGLLDQFRLFFFTGKEAGEEPQCDGEDERRRGLRAVQFLAEQQTPASAGTLSSPHSVGDILRKHVTAF